MKMITEELTEILSDAFDKCGYDKKLGQVCVSDRMDLCQFQCNGALSGAKIYKKAPMMIAKDVLAKLDGTDIFEKIEAVNPGFINMTLSDKYLNNFLSNMASDSHLGIPQAEKNEVIVLDYGGPNVAKPLHIGHLRSAIIGEAIKRLAKATGRTVYGDIHLGDWGLQIGLVIAELMERYPEWKCFSESFDPQTDTVEELNADLLNEIYPFASKKSKENEEFKNKAHQVTFELQNRRPGYIALWKEILRVSIADLKKSYDKLNVNFDLWYGESDADKYMNELFHILEQKKLMYESNGAMIVDVVENSDTAPMPPVIIKKSDDSVIYATTDLATIIQRQKDFHPDKIWYVVDKRQSLHFTQVFRCAKKAGLVPEDTELEHLGFGTMNGKDGKPYKTRDGGVMQLSELIKTVTESAFEKTDASHFTTPEEHRAVANKIGIAAVKFGDLINHRSKDYIFDLDKFLSTEGKTGVYLLYTATRINSVLKKAGLSVDADIKLSNIYTPVERELILSLILSGEAFSHAINEKALNIICENAYQIATAFSRFYQENHILNEENQDKKNQWLALCLITRKMLLTHLNILGIEAVDAM